MYVTAEHLRDQVIRPTLKYLGAWTSDTESFLLNAAIDAPDLDCSPLEMKAWAYSTSRHHNTVTCGIVTWHSIRTWRAGFAVWLASGLS